MFHGTGRCFNVLLLIWLSIPRLWSLVRFPSEPVLSLVLYEDDILTCPPDSKAGMLGNCYKLIFACINYSNNNHSNGSVYTFEPQLVMNFADFA